jgi:response regulator RpfG family c-di-GMP phosphodiesterase
MSLFSKKKPPAPPPLQPSAPPPLPPMVAPKPKADSVLKLELPDVFAFRNDATRAGDDLKPKHSRGTILLVETNDEIRRLLARLFQQEGYLLLTATCLAEAREMLKDRPADYVLARRACVPLNIETDIALRDLNQKTHVRIVDDFGELMLGQVVDYESMSQCTLALGGLLLSLLEGPHANARGHAQAVAKYCRMVGQRIGMSRRQLDTLTLAACLHDIGAIESDHNLSDPTQADGHALFQPTLDLLANIPFAYPVNDLLTAVTEKAVPENESLPPPPLGARVLRIVDTYDTLRRNHTSEFPDDEKVFDWMRRQPAGVFDVDALETLIHIRKHERAINAMNLFQEAVLIVEPHPEEIRLLALRLKNDDHPVLLAGSAAEAINQLRAQPVTLVLTENQLDGTGTGFDLLATIKNDPALRNIPVVFHGLSRTELVKQALELGAEDWYAKPINVEIVALKIGRILQRLRSRPAATEGVRGNLRDLGIIEMVQVLCAGRRSVHIQLDKDNDTAELIIHDGQIINARHGDTEGETAAIDALSWREGDFVILPMRDAPPPRITASTDSLLLRTCVAEDHRAANLPETGATP